jgi:DNA-binding transcriptional regulator YiaG
MLMSNHELVQQARRATRLSQAQFGRLLGVDHRYISKWERGDAVPSTTTQKLLQLILADPGGMMERLGALEPLPETETEVKDGD